MHNEVGIKGISNAVMRTAGTIDLKLFSDTHEIVHTYHVLGENSEMHYNAILGKDFFLGGRGEV